VISESQESLSRYLSSDGHGRNFSVPRTTARSFHVGVAAYGFLAQQSLLSTAL
jgi:hypothetical protein